MDHLQSTLGIQLLVDRVDGRVISHGTVPESRVPYEMTHDGTVQSPVGDALVNPPPTKSEIAVAEHDTLKYHLLGPSLTKAGQDAVDQQKVAWIQVLNFIQ